MKRWQKLLPMNLLLRYPCLSALRQFSNNIEGGCSELKNGFLQEKTSSVTLERCLGQPTPHTHSHLLKPGEITPGISRNEYHNRRKQLMSSIQRSINGSSRNHLVVILSGSKKYMTDEIPYFFRQNTNFLYLCGFQEPDSVLVLENLPDRDTPGHKSTLFVQNRDPDRELWDGPISGIKGAVQFIGVDEAYNVTEFPEALNKYSLREDLAVWYDVFKSTGTHDAFHQDVISHLINPCRNRGHTVNILEQMMHSTRIIKSPAECELMRKSVSIASKAFREVIKFSHAGVQESTLNAKIDYECRVRGAEFLAYPPVVAGGNRANTLHYINNNHSVQDGEMILMDAGCEYHAYASDITRTWPVNGKFTSAQAELYEAVLSVQKECIGMCHMGATLDQIYSFMLMGLGKRLQDLDVISNALSSSEVYKKTRKYCPHHVGHYLGMDTHDTPRMSRSNQLQPGMVITIEPGLYIPTSDLSAPARYRGIGIRIEDDILITDEEPENLSDECPKEMDDIEALMAKL